MPNEIDEVMEELPPEIGDAVRRFGFPKLAAAVYGVEELDLPTSARIIGQKLAERLAERRSLATGLSALADLVR